MGLPMIYMAFAIARLGKVLVGRLVYVIYVHLSWILH
jgi:hypothetical protein